MFFAIFILLFGILGACIYTYLLTTGIEQHIDMIKEKNADIHEDAYKLKKEDVWIDTDLRQVSDDIAELNERIDDSNIGQYSNRVSKLKSSVSTLRDFIDSKTEQLQSVNARDIQESIKNMKKHSDVVTSIKNDVKVLDKHAPNDLIKLKTGVQDALSRKGEVDSIRNIVILSDTGVVSNVNVVNLDSKYKSEIPVLTTRAKDAYDTLTGIKKSYDHVRDIQTAVINVEHKISDVDRKISTSKVKLDDLDAKYTMLSESIHKIVPAKLGQCTSIAGSAESVSKRMDVVQSSCVKDVQALKDAVDTRLGRMPILVPKSDFVSNAYIKKDEVNALKQKYVTADYLKDVYADSKYMDGYVAKDVFVPKTKELEKLYSGLDKLSTKDMMGKLEKAKSKNTYSTLTASKNICLDGFCVDKEDFKTLLKHSTPT